MEINAIGLTYFGGTLTLTNGPSRYYNVSVKECYGGCCGMRELGSMDWLSRATETDIAKVAEVLNGIFRGGQISFVLSNHQKRMSKTQLEIMKKQYGLRYMRLYNFNMNGYMHFYVWAIRKKEKR